MLLLLLLSACRPPTPAGDAALGRGEVLLAHTNDLHAHFLPTAAPWLPGSPELGGFVAIDAHLSALRASAGELVYLDGGDLLSGTPLMELEERGVAGGAMLSFLEAAGCDGWVVGNHELDRGIDHAQRFVAASEVAVLTANLRDPSGQRPLLDGTVARRIIDHNGLRIGVFGLTTDAMSGLTSRETAAALSVVPLAEAAREQVSEREG
ncbi:MAG: 5'-nucleotidase/UDP-sugar diphosphatase, partial [Myxococcota bacterium]